MTTYAERKAVEKAAKSWSDAIVACRSYGHAWKPSTVTSNTLGYFVAQVCSRKCGCRRVRFMDRNGFADRWRLTYPEDGYLLRGLGRVDRSGRAALALASIRHLQIKEVEG